MITLKIEIKYNLIETGSMVWLFKIFLKIFNKRGVNYSYTITSDNNGAHLKTTPYIRKKVCNFLNVPETHLSLKTRKREIVEARQLGHFFAKEITRDSLATIGFEIGGMDHATVLHSIKTVNNMRETNIAFRERLETLQKQL